ncbi:unnamed protein product [Arctogadus glacialis]
MYLFVCGLNESGLYQALDSSKEAVIIADYHVTVQEQVSPVVLNVSPGSPSSESCKVTVTCSTQSSSLNSTFTCTNQTCSENGDPAEVVTSDATLNLYLSNGSIVICNHSNKVSWSNDTMEIKPLCFKVHVTPSNNHHQGNKIIIISSCLLSFMAILGCILGALYKRRKKNKRNINSRVIDDQSPNGDQSPTVYSMLGPSSIPLEPIPEAAPEGSGSISSKECLTLTDITFFQVAGPICLISCVLCIKTGSH